MENNDSIILRSGLAIGGIVLLALLSMLSAMLIAESSKGDATAINLAGSLRMQSYRIATRLQDPVHHADPAAVAAVSGEIQAFESRLEQLWRTGAISTAMADSRHQMLRTLESAWREKLRPTLQAAAQAAPFPNHLREIDEFVARLDAFVKVLEQDSEAKIRLLRLVQGIALFLTLVLAFVAMHQLHSRVVVPLRDLVELARRARHGDLSVRIRHVGQDELGVLGQAFNLMAADLSTLYADLEARVEQQTQALRISNRSLELLYHTTRQLSESRLRDATYQAILSEVEKMTGLASVRLCLLDPTTTQATRVFTAGPAPAPVASFCEYPRCQSCLGEGFTHTLESSRQTFCIPVRDQDRQFGVLIVRNADLNTTAWQLPLLEAVARNLAAALYVNEQAEQVQRLALLEERNAMARDLHDSLAQALSYLKIQVSRLQTSASGAAMHAETQEIIAELRQGLNNAYRQLRELITTFRLKMQHSRLEDSLRGVVQELSQQSGGLLIQFDHADWTGVVLNPNEQIHLLQIIREALNNVVKHARATQARVQLRSLEDGEVMVEIDDDGIGLPDDAQKTHHFGLSIMHERAACLGGTLLLQSRPGCGVNVHLRFRPAARVQISPECLSRCAMPEDVQTILIIDDHPLMRRGIVQLVAMESALRLVGEAGNGQQGLALARQLRPDLILLDLNMRGLNGLETLRALKATDMDSRVLILTVSDSEEDVVAALRLGADGYLLKDMEPEDVLSCLRTAAQGRIALGERVAVILANALRHEVHPKPIEHIHLTEREQETLALIAAGYSNKLIARQLKIAEGTVKVHVKHLLHKLNLGSRVEAAVWAVTHLGESAHR